MDYEKKYKELQSLAKSYQGNSLKEFLDLAFPELKESEDERIKMDILETLRYGLACEESVLMPGATTTLKEAIAYLERQKKQQPSWKKIDKLKESVVFPFNARVKDNDKVVTIIDGQLNFDGKLWIKFVSNKDDGFKVYNPEDLLVEHKPAEWSEEDERNLYNIIEAIKYAYDISKDGSGSRLITWLKSFCLQPHTVYSVYKRRYKV